MSSRYAPAGVADRRSLRAENVVSPEGQAPNDSHDNSTPKGYIVQVPGTPDRWWHTGMFPTRNVDEAVVYRTAYQASQLSVGIAIYSLALALQEQERKEG